MSEKKYIVKISKGSYDLYIKDAEARQDIGNHTSNTSNPHSVTKSQVGLGNVTNDAQVKRTEMGAASGVATLDSSGKVPASQLPSYVDDVVDLLNVTSTAPSTCTKGDKYYNTSSNKIFTATGKNTWGATGETPETGKIYINLSNSKTYRWSSTALAVISDTLALGETSSTAYYGDKGKTAYTHSQMTSGNPHNVTKSDVGLGNVGNFKAVSTVASQGLTDTEKSNARINIGAGTSSFSGSYNDLSNKPTIPAAAANGTYTVKTLVGSTTTNVSDFTANQSSADDITFIQGTNVTLTTDTTNRTVTIAAKDTTYSAATASAAGLMSAADFKKINAQAIPENANLNDYTTDGWYYCSNNSRVATFTNCPTTNALYMEVHTHAGKYQHIVEYMTSGAKHYHRNYYNDAWGAWTEWKLTDNNTVTSINGKTGAIAAADIATVLTGAGYKLTDANTWKAATTSQEGYIPTLALSGTSSGAKKDTINTQASDYVLTYTSGTETAPVWRKLPANAYANNTYTVNNGTFTVKGAGTAVSSTSANASGNTAVDIVAGSNVTITPDATNGKITIASTDTNTWRPVGTGASDAAAGNHTHGISLATDSGTSTVTLAHNTTYKLTAGGQSVIFKTPTDNNTNTTYTFAGGTNKFTVTPSGGSAQDVTVTPSISNNVTASGNFAADAIIVGNAANQVAKNSGKTITTTAPSSSAADTTVPTSKAVWTAIGNGIATNDAMVYKGTIAGGSTGSYGALTAAANRGWTYKVSTAGKINGVAVEVGDMIICNTDSTAAATSDTYSTIAAKWDVIQTNVDGALFKSSNSFTDAHVLVADGTAGKVKDSGFTIGKSVPSNAVFTDTNTAVTAVGNHYAPTADSNSSLTASASGATAAWSIDVVKGVTLSRDAKGHVTAVSVTSGKIPGNPNTDRYVNSAAFADNTSSDASNPLKMTLTRAGSDTSTVTANLPKVSSSSAGVVPKGAAVSSQSQSTKFLREDGTWAAPSYTTNTNTDTLVTQTATTTSANYEVLFSATADNTTRTETARKNSNLTFNPSTGNLSVTQINGVTVGSSPKFTDNNTTYKLTVNGTTNGGGSTNLGSVYAPDAAGTAGQVLLSSGGKPNWKTGDIIHYVTSPSGTAGTTNSNRTIWTGTIDGVTALYTGLMIMIKVPLAGVNKGVELNVNNLGGHPVVLNTNSIVTTHYPVGAIMPLVYDADQKTTIMVSGTNTEYTGCWKIANYDSNSNTISQGYCETATNKAAKVASCTNFSLANKSYIMVDMRYPNSYDGKITLNINSTGAKDIYINGSVSSSSNKTLPAGSYLVYYADSKYYFRTDGKITGSITGDAATVSGKSAATIVNDATKFSTAYIGAGASASAVAVAANLKSNLRKGAKTSVTASSNKLWVLVPSTYDDPTVLMSGIEVPMTAQSNTTVSGVTYKVWSSNNTYTGTFNVVLL